MKIIYTLGLKNYLNRNNMKIGVCYKVKSAIGTTQLKGIYTIDSKVIKPNTIVLFCGVRKDMLLGSKIYQMFCDNTLYEIAEGGRMLEAYLEEIKIP